MGIIPGGGEWIILLVIVLVFFGAKKLPELAKGLGKSITNFKSGLNEAQEEETTVQEKDAPQEKEVG